jgi:hypothetical protein
MDWRMLRPRTHRLTTKRAMINEQPQAVPLNGDHVCAVRNSSCLMVVSHERSFQARVPAIWLGSSAR